MSLGEHLRKLRQAQKMTQRQLAEPRYTAAHVSTIESGRRYPSREALKYFAQKLGVTEDELVTGRPAHLSATLELEVQRARKALSDGRIPQARRVLNRVIRDARTHGLHREAARAQELLGLCDLRNDNVDGALRRYVVAEQMLSDEPITARIGAVIGKAMCLWQHGDLHHAIFVLENALETAVRTGVADPEATFRIQTALVGLYFEVGAYDRAFSAASQSLELASCCKDPETVARLYMCAGRTHLARGDYERARDLFRSAERLFREGELRLEIGQAHLALGFGLAAQGNYDEAAQRFGSALETFREIGSSLDEARTLNEAAKLERKRGNNDLARRHLRRALHLLRGDVDVMELALTYRELGALEADVDEDLAEKHLRHAIDLYERAGAQRALAEARRVLGNVYLARGELAAACEEYRTGLAVLELER